MQRQDAWLSWGNGRPRLACKSPHVMLHRVFFSATTPAFFHPTITFTAVVYHSPTHHPPMEKPSVGTALFGQKMKFSTFFSSQFINSTSHSFLFCYMLMRGFYAFYFFLVNFEDGRSDHTSEQEAKQPFDANTSSGRLSDGIIQHLLNLWVLHL